MATAGSSSPAQAIVAALDPASAAALPAPNKDWSPIRLAMSDRVLVLAGPPEAGWRMRTASDERATADAELLAGPGCEDGG